MITLNVSELVRLQEKIVIATGGIPGVRDMGLLESAVLSCYQTFESMDLYPSIIEKAARLAYAVNRNHPFVDGNKRVAVTSMLVMLRLNSIRLIYNQRELVELGLGIAEGRFGHKEVVGWINSHLE